MSTIQSMQIAEPNGLVVLPETQGFQESVIVSIGVANLPLFAGLAQIISPEPRQQLAIMSKDISASEWKASLYYSESETKDFVGKFLAEFQIEANQSNITWLLDTVTGIVSLYKKQYDIALSDEQTKALRNLVLRIAYDRLRIE